MSEIIEQFEQNTSIEFMNYGVDQLVGLYHCRKFTDSIRCSEVTELTNGPIIGYGPVRNVTELIKPRKSSMRFIDGSLIHRIWHRDIILAYSSALLLLYEQTPATRANVLLCPDSTIMYLEEHVGKLKKYYVLDDGFIVGAIKQDKSTCQTIIALPVELSND